MFDVFLSHSYTDAKLNTKRLLSIKAFLEQFELQVYVDWIIDKNLEREEVSPKTARTLRKRMDHSKCLLFATSENFQESKWMPWELGYMDGKSQRVAILPLTRSAGRTQFRGQEYLGFYPYLDKSKAKSSKTVYLWVCHDKETYVRFDLWIGGEDPRKH